MTIVAQAYEYLAHAFRVLLEARLRASELFTVNYYPEAVENIEAGYPTNGAKKRRGCPANPVTREGPELF